MKANTRKMVRYVFMFMLAVPAIAYLYAPFIDAPLIFDFASKTKWIIVAVIFVLLGFLLVKLFGIQNALLSLFSLFFSLSIIDYCLHARFIKLGKAHDLENIPFQEPFLTKDRYKVAVMEKLYDKEIVSSGQVSFRLPDDGFYEPRRMRVSTDELGLRNKPGSSKSPQDVIIIGDSFAFGYGCDQAKIWSNVLAVNSGLKVYNAAVYGIGPSHAVELLGYLLENNLIHLNNNATIFLTIFGGNDFTDPNIYSVDRSKSAVWWQMFKGYINDGLISKLLNRIYAALEPKGGPGYWIYSSSFGKSAFSIAYSNAEEANNYSLPMAKSTFENRSSVPKSFQRLKELADQYHFHPVIFYIPTKERAYQEVFKDIPRLPVDHMENLTEKEAQRLFAGGYYDFTDIFQKEAGKGRWMYWKDDTHLNDFGQSLLATASMSMMHEGADKEK